MGDRIGQLMDCIPDRHNVHKSINDMARDINARYMYLCSAEADLLQRHLPGTEGKLTQTTPSVSRRTESIGKPDLSPGPRFARGEDGGRGRVTPSLKQPRYI